MKSRPFRLAVPLLLALMSLTVMGSKKPGKVTPESAAKADYMFLEAMSRSAASDYVTYIELLSRAHDLNPNDTTIGFYSGFMNLLFTAGDTTEQYRMYKLMRDYALANPDDYVSARIFANVAEKVDRGDDIMAVWQLLHQQFPKRPDFTFGYAQAMAKFGGPAGIDSALSLLDTLEVVQGQSLGLSSNKMRLLMGRGDTLAVVDELKRLLKFAPQSVENNIFAGDVYSLLSMNDTALYYYDRACQIDSTSGDAFYSRAAFYHEIGDSARYDEEIFNALGKSSLDVDVKMEILKSYVGEIYRDSIQYNRVGSLFDHIIAMHPHTPQLHALYANYLLTRGDYAEAAVQQGFALDISPENVDQWKMLMTLWRAADEPEKAIEAGKQALKYFPDNVQIKTDMGMLLGQKDDIKGARQCFDEVLESLGPGDNDMRALVLTCIGDMFTTHHQPDSAIVYYEQSVVIDPENALTLNNLAYMMAEADVDLDRARTLVEKSLMIKPDNTSALDTYAWVLFKQKEYKLAKTQIDKAIELTPELSAEVLSHAGDIYFMNGLPDEAVELWKQALELTPDDEMLKRKVKHRAYFFK